MKNIFTNNLFRSFSIVAGLALVLFGVYHLLNYGSVFLGYVESGVAFLIFINLLFARNSYELLHRHILTGLVCIVLVALFATGGIENTGIFWFFMFPIAAFFLLGPRGGFVWVGMLVVISTSMVFIGIGAYVGITLQQAIAVLVVVTLLTFLYEKRRDGDEHVIALERERMKTLYEITTYKDKLGDQFRAALLLGSKTLDTKINVLSHIEKDKFMVEYGVMPPNTLHEGDVFNLEETYCDITVKKDDVLSIDEMKTDVHKTHVCYTKFKLEAYIGVPVKVFGKLHGTLTFMSPDPHRPGFTESDRDFVRLMGKWMSVSLEREQIEKMKSEFVSVASHQLRTPLTGIRWFAELLLKGKAGKISTDQKDFLDQIYQSNDRMIKLVEDLLNVSRIDTGSKFEIKKAPKDLVEIINSLTSDLIGLAHQYEVEIQKSEGFPEKYELPIDADKIRQVFQNLLSNAVKYSKKGGVVEILFENKKDKILISVKDTGLGIPEKQQSRMFEKFFRADNVKTVETDGTGLGLYIAKAIVEGHGGKIWFESKENTRTSFFVELPNSPS